MLYIYYIDKNLPAKKIKDYFIHVGRNTYVTNWCKFEAELTKIFG